MGDFLVRGTGILFVIEPKGPAVSVATSPSVVVVGIGVELFVGGE